MIRIIHMADSHLGFNVFQKTAPDGSNFRECTINENFLKSAEVISDAEPDVVAHSGDLFHNVKPKTRTIISSIKFLNVLKENKIQFVGIPGNHSMPKNLYTSSVFEILKKACPEIMVAYSYRYEHITTNGIEFHLIPNMLCSEGYLKAADDAKCYNKSNPRASKSPHVLITHGLACNALDERLSSIAEFELTEDVIDENSYDYIALGHVHKQQQLGSKTYYSGSAEHLTYGEASDKKGALIIDIDTDYLKITPLELPKSPMWDIAPIDCSEVKSSDLPSMIEERMKVTGGMYDQMYRFTLDFGESRILTIPSESLKELSEKVMDIQIVSKNTATERMKIEQTSPKAIDYIEDFGRFVSTRNDITEARKAKISTLGMKTLQTVIANRSEIIE